MREFTDSDETVWVATIARRHGPDYKGRYHLIFSPKEGGELFSLVDVRWNSEETAERTLATMSTVELRRRLRSATGRSRVPGLP